MAYIAAYPLRRHLRSDASSHINRYRAGRIVKSGRGLAFWFDPSNSSIVEVPMDDRELPFLLKGQSKDHQDVTVQGNIVWRVSDPTKIGERVDFSINLSNGKLVGKPIDQINSMIVTLTRRFTSVYVKGHDVRDLLEKGVAPLQGELEAGFAKDQTLPAMGLELVNVSVANVAASSELSRALQTPTFERLQQQADEATFARRALAVEKERAIAENELNNQVELATRQKSLIERENENARTKSLSAAETLKIEAEAEANQIRVIEQAKLETERERLAIYGDLPPMVLLGMAAQEFAGKLQNIDNLSITPDMLSGVVSQIQKTLAQPKA